MNTDIVYRPLGTLVKRQGFIYRQRLRDGNWAIYEQLRKPEETLVAFEIIRIGHHNGFSRTINGQELNFPPAETYPTSSMWGRSGWTVRDYDDAVVSMRKRMVEKGDAEEEIIDDTAIAEMLSEAKDEDDSLGEAVVAGA